MSDDDKSESAAEREARLRAQFEADVKAEREVVKSDTGVGLMKIPKGTDAKALARRVAGQIVKNEMEFHCMACGWSKSLRFEPDELEALDNNIRDYTGPCPGCGAMMLTPKDVLWGNDFPSMSELARKNKREDAKVQAEEFVDAAAKKVGEMMGGAAIPKPTIEDPGESPDRSDLPEEPDTSGLKPR